MDNKKKKSKSAIQNLIETIKKDPSKLKITILGESLPRL